MKKKIFYSWQSDLDNNTNRGYIQKCLSEVIKNVAEGQLDLDPVLDRDTFGTSGSPEIASTIFNKIDNAHIHVADISIINQNSPGRKMPNPNVLIELGYAARVLGWEHVITIFNTDTGLIEELPFDLRSRRPIAYSGENRKKDKLPLQKSLEVAIRSILALDTPTESVRNHIKSKLDSLILEAYSHLFKLCFGYKHKDFEQLTWAMLDWKTEDIAYHLFEKKVLGFLDRKSVV